MIVIIRYLFFMIYMKLLSIWETIFRIEVTEESLIASLNDPNIEEFPY